MKGKDEDSNKLWQILFFKACNSLQSSCVKPRDTEIKSQITAYDKKRQQNKVYIEIICN